MDYMNCSTCQALVQLNATGICLGCQMGFISPMDEEIYKSPQQKKMEALETRKKEVEDAISEGEEQKSGERKYTQRNARRKTAETGDSDRSKRSRKSKKEKKEIAE